MILDPDHHSRRAPPGRARTVGLLNRRVLLSLCTGIADWIWGCWQVRWRRDCLERCPALLDDSPTTSRAARFHQQDRRAGMPMHPIAQKDVIILQNQLNSASQQVACHPSGQVGAFLSSKSNEEKSSQSAASKLRVVGCEIEEMTPEQRARAVIALSVLIGRWNDESRLNEKLRDAA